MHIPFRGTADDAARANNARPRHRVNTPDRWFTAIGPIPVIDPLHAASHHAVASEQYTSPPEFMLFDTTRELVAYGLIAAILVLGLPWLAITFNKRRRDKLRRRGIKRHGH
ncbi:hypothetical protein [Sphingomonas spermidinifaciens]|uniref:hypothetical protein n=1 Tax=Sphingomonas spermidinifaciens TaxID=1141889 RepID=UPI001142A921|nr:hypothetical protein [Sphingomonas spermidinifaciens]